MKNSKFKIQNSKLGSAIRKPSHISDTIKEVFENLDQTNKTGVGKDNVCLAWERAAGKTAARHSAPVSLRNKTLIVSVDSTVWMYQLRLQNAGLLKKINKQLKSHSVESIRLRAGEIEGR